MEHTDAALVLLYDELHAQLEQLEHTPANTVRVASFLQVHAADLKSIVAARHISSLLRLAADAGNPDIVLALLEAGAVPMSARGMYYFLLKRRIYGMNGAELDDAGIARRLRIIHDVHGVRPLPSEFMSLATLSCVKYDRLECLRIMDEIDPQARGYTEGGHESLLHIAAKHCKPRIVRFLLENGWSLTGVDLDDDGLSPLGCCLFSKLPRSHSANEAICDTLDALLHNVEDASVVVRNSGLCDAVDYRSAGGCNVPAPKTGHVHMYTCAAVHAYSKLPRRVLDDSRIVAAVIRHSASKSLLLTLDAHVHTGIGDPVYLRDSLRVASSFDRAVRQATAVDALCSIEAMVNADWKLWRYATCMDVHESDTAVVSGFSPTLRCWAWMRRLHAVTARRHILRREAAWRRGVTIAAR